MSKELLMSVVADSTAAPDGSKFDMRILMRTLKKTQSLHPQEFDSMLAYAAANSNSSQSLKEVTKNMDKSASGTCKTIFANIEKELDERYALTTESNISGEALMLYQQLYDDAVRLFTRVGFDIVRQKMTNKHTVKFKTVEDMTRLFE